MPDEAVILLAEDREDDILLIRKAFQKGGIDNPFFVVRDGEEAVAYLKGSGKFSNRSEYPLPSLLLLDLKMPRIDGFEVLKWIRQESPWKTLVVIVLTSSTSESDMNQAYSLGANAYIIKPSDATKLREFAQLVKQFWLGWNQWPPMTNAGGTRPMLAPQA